MKLNRRIAASLAATAVLAAACQATPDRAMPAAWQVDAAKSTLNFVTTKAGQAGAGGIGEVQSFGQFSGGMSAAGQISLSVALTSVATGVDIRDERLRTMLFNVAAHPTATFSAQIDPALLNNLAPGTFKDIDVAGQFTLAGQSRPLPAKLRVARLSSQQLSVTTRNPIVMDVSQYGLKTGVDAMREVMGLNFLASTAPVSLHLVLNEKS